MACRLQGDCTECARADGVPRKRRCLNHVRHPLADIDPDVRQRLANEVQGRPWWVSEQRRIADRRDGLVAHGLYVLFFYNFAWIPLLVDEGRMDGFFMRPLPVFTQLLLSQFSVNAIGDLLVGFSTLGVALVLVHDHWTIVMGLYLLIAVIAGALVEGAVQLTLSCLLLRSPGSRVLGSWVDELLSTLNNYPLSILPRTVQGLFTFVLPLAFVANSRSGSSSAFAPKHGATSILAHWSPLVGFVLFFLACKLWGYSLRRYHSAGR